MLTALADYNYYKDSYKGSLIKDEATFNSLIVKASMLIGTLTMNKVFDSKYIDLDAVKMCACEIVDEFQKDLSVEISSIEHAGISSEKVGDYSISYSSSNSSVDLTVKDERKQRIVNQYLAYTGLLYSKVGVLSC